MNNKALIAMSGGVDSSVAAFLMKSRGFDCTGATMKLFFSEADDAGDAKNIANNLGMKHYLFDFSEDFERQVIKKFTDDYENGLTPNPCIECNRYMKFEKLHSRANELGIDYVVTGHYARIEYDENSNRYLLKKAKDLGKDQSYVLYSMTPEQLKHTIFPLGELNKAEVRKIAAAQGFINANKSESQDICFVPDGDYAAFIEKYTGRVSKSGDFVDTGGNCLGQHNGLIRYTTGQRKGLGISLNKPMYVKDKNVKNNTVTLCEADGLFSDSLTACNFNWIGCDKPLKPLRIKAKVRYNQTEQPAVAELMTDDLVRVVFDEPQRAITKGQAVVLYDGDTVIGGGTII